MCYFKWRRGQSSPRLVARNFECADPIIALVITPHVRASWRYGISFDRLVLEGGSSCCPILQGSIFKIQVQRFAILARWQNPFARCSHESAGGKKSGQGDPACPTQILFHGFVTFGCA